MNTANTEVITFDYDAFRQEMNCLDRRVAQHARKAQIAAASAILNR